MTTMRISERNKNLIKYFIKTLVLLTPLILGILNKIFPDKKNDSAKNIIYSNKEVLVNNKTNNGQSGVIFDEQSTNNGIINITNENNVTNNYAKEESKNTFDTNIKILSFNDFLLKKGYISDSNNAKFNIEFISSSNIYEKEGLYKYDSGYLIIEVNSKKINFYNLKYESSFKYGNSQSITNKELNDKLVNLVENNKTEIYTKLKPYLK